MEQNNTGKPSLRSLLTAVTIGMVSAVAAALVAVIGVFVIARPPDAFDALIVWFVAVSVVPIALFAGYLLVGLPLLVRATKAGQRKEVLAAYLGAPVVVALLASGFVLGAADSTAGTVVAIASLSLPWIAVAWAGGHMRHRTVLITLAPLMALSIVAGLPPYFSGS